MTSGIGSAVFTLSTDSSNFSSGIEEAKSQASAAASQIASDIGSLSAPFDLVTGAASAFTGALADIALASYGLQQVQSFVENIAESFLGSAANVQEWTTRLAIADAGANDLQQGLQEANGQLAVLQGLATDEGLSLPSLELAAVRLQTIGGATADTVANIQRIADVAAAVGQPMDLITNSIELLYAQLQGGQPITRAVIPLERLGIVSGATVTQLQDMQKQGASAQDMVNVVLAALDKFQGSAQAIGDTTAGTFAKLQQTWDKDVRAAADGLLSSLQPVIQQLTDWFNSGTVQSAFEAFGSLVTNTFQAVVAFIQQHLGDFESFFDTISKAAGQIDIQGFVNVGAALLDLGERAIPVVIQAFADATQIFAAISPVISGVIGIFADLAAALTQHPQLVFAIVAAWAAFNIVAIVTDLGGLAAALLGIPLALLGWGPATDVAAGGMAALAAGASALDIANATAIDAIDARIAAESTAAGASELAAAQQVSANDAEIAAYNAYLDAYILGGATVESADEARTAATIEQSAARIAVQRDEAAQIGLVLAQTQEEIATADAAMAEENASFLDGFSLFSGGISSLITGGILVAVVAMPGVFSDALNGVLSVVEDVGQAIYTALQWLDPFASHSPPLVSQVTDGMNTITNVIAQAPNTISTSMAAVGTAVESVGPKFQGMSAQAIESLAKIDLANAQHASQTMAAQAAELLQANTLPQLSPAARTATDAMGTLTSALAGLNDQYNKSDFSQLASKLAEVDPGAISSIQQAQSAISALTDQVSQEQQAWQAAQQALQPYTDQLNSLKDAGQILTDQIAVATDNLQPFHDAIDQAKSKLSDLQDTQQAYKDSLQGLQDNLDSASASLEQLAGPLQDQKDQFDDAKNSVNEYKKSIQDAATSVKNSFDDQKQPIEDAKATIEDQLADLADKMTGVPAKLKETYDTITKQFGKGGQEISKSTPHTVEVDNPVYLALKAQKDQLDEQQRGLNKQERDISTKERDAANQSRDQLDPTKNTVLAGLEATQKAASDQYDKLNSQYQTQKEKVDAAKAALASHTVELQHNATAVADQQVKVRQATQALQTHSGTLDALKEAQKQNTAQVDAAKLKFDLLNQALAPIHEKYTQDKQDLDQLNQSYQKFVSLINSAAQQYQTAQRNANTAAEAAGTLAAAQNDAAAAAQKYNDAVSAGPKKGESPDEFNARTAVLAAQANEAQDKASEAQADYAAKLATANGENADAQNQALAAAKSQDIVDQSLVKQAQDYYSSIQDQASAAKGVTSEYDKQQQLQAALVTAQGQQAKALADSQGAAEKLASFTKISATSTPAEDADQKAILAAQAAVARDQLDQANLKVKQASADVTGDDKNNYDVLLASAQNKLLTDQGILKAAQDTLTADKEALQTAKDAAAIPPPPTTGAAYGQTTDTTQTGPGKLGGPKTGDEGADTLSPAQHMIDQLKYNLQDSLNKVHLDFGPMAQNMQKDMIIAIAAVSFGPAIIGALQTVLGAAIGTLGGWLGSLLLTEVPVALGGFVGAMAASIGGIFLGAFQALKDIQHHDWEAIIVGTLSAVVLAAIAAFLSVPALIVAGVAGVGYFLGSMFDKTKLGKFVIGKAEDLANLVWDELKKIPDAVLDLIKGAGSFLARIWGGLSGWLSGLGGSGGTAPSGGGTLSIDTSPFSKLGDTIAKALIAGFTGALGSGYDLLKWIGGGLADFGGFIGGKAADFGRFVASGFKAGISAAFDLLKWIGGGLADFGATITTTARQWGGDVKSGIVSGIGAVFDLLKWITGGVADFASSIQKTMSTVGQNIRTSVINGIGAAFDLWKWITGDLTNLYKNLETVGKNIATAIKNGIGDLGSLISNALPKSVGIGPVQIPIPSRQSGDWNVQADTISRLHAGEMVLPPNLAETVRAAFGTTPQALPAGAGARPAGTAATGGTDNQTQQLLTFQQQQVTQQAAQAQALQQLNNNLTQQQNAQTTNMNRMAQALNQPQPITGPLVQVQQMSVQDQADLQRLADMVNQILAQLDSSRRRALGNGVE